MATEENKENFNSFNSKYAEKKKKAKQNVVLSRTLAAAGTNSQLLMQVSVPGGWLTGAAVGSQLQPLLVALQDAGGSDRHEDGLGHTLLS